MLVPAVREYYSECLTIEGTATSETGLDANFLGIDDLPLTDLALSVSIKHKEGSSEKNIRVIVIAKLTIEGTGGPGRP